MNTDIIISETEAHPRVGGENPSTGAPNGGRRGSSPRGRGKPYGRCDPYLAPRLIPAWAGKTRPRARSRPLRRAHPRVGGENFAFVVPMVLAGGSSPRGRGKLSTSDSASVRQRLIPAWAGKTEQSSGQPHSWPAHPRVGGENCGSSAYASANQGSSPRGRGKLEAGDLVSVYEGLIPAWAGKTLT